MDVATAIDNHVKYGNEMLAAQLDRRHSKADIRIFSLRKRSYLEEDVFKYFYPFCLVNVPLASMFLVRKQLSWPALFSLGLVLLEYTYFLFSFPVENHHFHRRALNDT